MAQSLLGRIARRPVRLTKDEAEDRLTEVVAAVLAHPECPGLAGFVVLGWLKSALHDERLSNRGALAAIREQLAAGGWMLRVNTQLVVSADGRTRRPDLELGFTSPDRPDLTAWVEVKHGAEPERNQLCDYVLAQHSRGLASRGAVLLVAPRAGYEWFDPSQIPDTVPTVTWQQTGSLLATYTTTSSIGAFLVDELCHYLREEGLMDPERITAEHLVAFAHHKEAFEALDLLCSAATAHIAAQWAPLAPEQYGSRSGSISWWMFPTCRDGMMPLEGREFDFNLFRDSTGCFRDGRPGVPVFTVGTSGEPGTIAALDAETADALADAGFQLLPKASLLSNNWDRIWRRAYPDELLAGATLEDQGNSLARWVVDAFEQLHATVAAARAR